MGHLAAVAVAEVVLELLPVVEAPDVADCVVAGAAASLFDPAPEVHAAVTTTGVPCGVPDTVEVTSLMESKDEQNAEALPMASRIASTALMSARGSSSARGMFLARTEVESMTGAATRV